MERIGSSTVADFCEHGYETSRYQRGHNVSRLREITYARWCGLIKLALDTAQWLVYVNTTMNLRVPQTTGNLLSEKLLATPKDCAT